MLKICRVDILKIKVPIPSCSSIFFIAKYSIMKQYSQPTSYNLAISKGYFTCSHRVCHMDKSLS